MDVRERRRTKGNGGMGCRGPVRRTIVHRPKKCIHRETHLPLQRMGWNRCTTTWKGSGWIVRTVLALVLILSQWQVEHLRQIQEVLAGCKLLVLPKVKGTVEELVFCSGSVRNILKPLPIRGTDAAGCVLQKLCTFQYLMEDLLLVFVVRLMDGRVS